MAQAEGETAAASVCSSSDSTEAVLKSRAPRMGRCKARMGRCKVRLQWRLPASQSSDSSSIEHVLKTAAHRRGRQKV